MFIDPSDTLTFIAYCVLAGCVFGFVFTLLFAVIFGPTQRD